jgi:hypothetical protein
MGMVRLIFVAVNLRTPFGGPDGKELIVVSAAVSNSPGPGPANSPDVLLR